MLQSIVVEFKNPTHNEGIACVSGSVMSDSLRPYGL